MTFERNLRQDVTHWPVTGSDGFGGFTFGSPVLLRGRWEDTNEIFTDGVSMEQAVSRSIVYLGADIDEGDYLALGDFVTGTPVTDPTTVTSHRIRTRDKSTDLRGLRTLRKAYL